MAPHPRTMGNPTSTRSLKLALAVSLGVHALLWLGFSHLGQPVRESGTGLDTRIVDSTEGPGLRLEPQTRRGIQEPQSFEVKVEQGPVVPPEGQGEKAPVVRMRASRAPGGGAGGGTPRGSASFFAVPVACRRTVFVVDRSLSMGRGGALAAARRELMDCLRALPPGALFQVALYNRGVEWCAMPGSSAMLEATETNLRRVESLLARTRPEGATDHEQALKEAMNLGPDAIFLVTDADDLTAEQLGRITSANRDKVAVHTINVGQRLLVGGMLERLAAGSGGRYVQARAPR